MKAFIWTVVILFAVDSAAKCINLARGVELTPTDRAISGAIQIALAVWGVYAVASEGT